jgi:alkylation response protein AidB-like acyl-CoA dehydrogenase
VSVGLNDDQRTLAQAIGDWALAADLAEVVKSSETQGPAVFEPAWTQLVSLGVTGIAAAGGSFLDAAVAVEACARGMVPGPVLTTVLAGFVAPVEGIENGSVSVGLALPNGVVWGATATHVLTGEGVVPLTAEPAKSVDLSNRVAPSTYVPVSDLQVAAALAAAEGAGIARWALETAVAYAKVREQFGRTIGSFQSIKHLCAQMLERAESATAVAWDAASAYDEEPEQFRFAATVAAATALDAAVLNAQDCIQILGGIGFTWEHDAHLYLRRAMANRQLLGGTDRWLVSLAEQALAGVRRTVHIDAGPAETTRVGLREEIAELGVDRRKLAEAGLLMPHWPPPYGRGAKPLEQIVIDEEFEAAGVNRPDIAIGAWAAPTILKHGTDAQRERFIPPTLTGDIFWCQLFSEPGAGSDLAALRTRAVRDGDGWRLTGQKVWTSAATFANWAICLARTNPDAPRHEGITYFLVDMSSEGIDIRPLRELTGDALFNEVFLDGVFVPDDCVVGEVDGGWPLARTTLANERVAISGSSLGASIELALSVAARRSEIGEVLKLRLGQGVANASTNKALGMRVTLRSIAGDGPGAESSVQKLVGVHERQSSAELAVNVLEEQALLGDEARAVHTALLTRCLSIAGGTTQVLRNVAAERILGLPRD